MTDTRARELILAALASGETLRWRDLRNALADGGVVEPGCRTINQRFVYPLLRSGDVVRLCKGRYVRRLYAGQNLGGG